MLDLIEAWLQVAVAIIHALQITATHFPNFLI